MNPFATACSIDRVAEGRYHSFLDDSWNLRPLSQGGVIAAFLPEV